jgi:DNA-binding PadR family transcriptional regulator
MSPRAESSLSRSAFLILLAITDQPRHGLGIVEEVEARTGGDVRLGPGTLYTMLKRLLDDGHIRETNRAPDPADDDPRRRYYRITPRGLSALRAEAEHMRRLLEVAALKDVLGGGA